MIVTITDEMRGTLTHDGSFLKRLRCSGGLAHGLLAGGVTLLIFAILTGALFLAVGLTRGAFMFGAVLCIPGLVLIIYGRIAHNKRIREYMDYYLKVTGLGRDDLSLADREILEPDTILIGHPIKAIHKKDYSLGCFITKHFLIVPLPGGTCYLRRLQDLAAAVYSNEVPGVCGYVSGITFMAKNDELPGYDSFLPEDECMEVIRILKERYPRIITDQKFMYEGKQYDVMKDYLAVARLFREVHG